MNTGDQKKARDEQNVGRRQTMLAPRPRLMLGFRASLTTTMVSAALPSSLVSSPAASALGAVAVVAATEPAIEYRVSTPPMVTVMVRGDALVLLLYVPAAPATCAGDRSLNVTSAMDVLAPPTNRIVCTSPLATPACLATSTRITLA